MRIRYDKTLYSKEALLKAAYHLQTRHTFTLAWKVVVSL